MIMSAYTSITPSSLPRVPEPASSPGRPPWAGARPRAAVGGGNGTTAAVAALRCGRADKCTGRRARRQAGAQAGGLAGGRARRQARRQAGAQGCGLAGRQARRETGADRQTGERVLARHAGLSEQGDARGGDERERPECDGAHRRVPVPAPAAAAAAATTTQ